MLKTLTASRTRKDCPHLEATITQTAGIERAVCPVSGHVTIAYLEDGITVETGTRPIPEPS